jgi:hypothetical protein
LWRRSRIERRGCQRCVPGTSRKKGGKASNYEDQTKDQLMKRAADVGVEGRSKMDKGELISALRNH